VQVHVPEPQPLARLADRLLSLDEPDQVRHVERLGEHPDAVAGVARRGPVLDRPVAVELDPVPVGVVEVDRLGDAVVRRAGDRRARDRQPLEGAGQLLAVWEEQREVVEPRVAAGRPRAGVLVEDEHVLGLGAERGDRGVVRAHAQPDRVLVEADRPVEVGDGDVDGAEPGHPAPGCTSPLS
jgi:hypothetical protein